MKGKLVHHLHGILTEPINIFSGALLIFLLVILLAN